MKAKELMLGDWVYNTYHKKNIKITPYDFFTHGHLNGHQYIMGLGTPCLGRDLEPIPLTPEILEKNGFKYNDEEVYDDCIWSDGNIMLRLEYGFRIVVTNDFDDESTNRTPFVLRYVHQLQHALRLCGIDKEIVV